MLPVLHSLLQDAYQWRCRTPAAALVFSHMAPLLPGGGEGPSYVAEMDREGAAWEPKPDSGDPFTVTSCLLRWGTLGGGLSWGLGLLGSPGLAVPPLFCRTCSGRDLGGGLGQKKGLLGTQSARMPADVHAWARIVHRLGLITSR